MREPLQIDADLPDHRSFVKFRNFDEPCFMLSRAKSLSDAKNFREAAGLLLGLNDERANAVAGWLNDLASKYSTGELG